MSRNKATVRGQLNTGDMSDSHPLLRGDQPWKTAFRVGRPRRFIVTEVVEDRRLFLLHWTSVRRHILFL